nr:MAG TPA: hypothetical protein [Caudoviricetes sp.]
MVRSKSFFGGSCALDNLALWHASQSQGAYCRLKLWCIAPK